MRGLSRWVVAASVMGAACASNVRAPRVPRPEPRASTPSPTRVVASSAPAPLVAGTPAHTELYVHCEELESCSAAVGMLVVEDAQASEPERCTVSLIGRDLALTASHCLLPEQRNDGAACAGVWIQFPQTADAPEEQVACARVESARGGAVQDGLHSEHALLRLARRLERPALVIDPTPLAADQIVTVVSVTPHPVYGSTHSQTSRLCRTASPERAEEALGPAAANVGWLSDCPIEHGNSGSPVLDYHGNLRAIVHGGTSTSSAFAVTSAPPRS